MSSDPKLDILLKLKMEMEHEIQEIRDHLAGKTKALNSLCETIDLVRGWVPRDETPKTERTTYDEASLISAIEDILLATTGPVGISVIINELTERELIPTSNRDAVRRKLNRLIKDKMPGVEMLGWAKKAKYQLKA